MHQKGKDMKKIQMKNELQTFAKHWAIEPSAMQLVATTFKEVQSGLSLFAQKPLVNTYTTSIRDGPVYADYENDTAEIDYIFYAISKKGVKDDLWLYSCQHR